MGLLVILSVPFLIIAKITGETYDDIMEESPLRAICIVGVTMLVIHIIASSILTEEEAAEAREGNDEFKFSYLVVFFILSFFCSKMFINKILITSDAFKYCMLSILVLCDIIHMSAKHSFIKSYPKVVIELIYTQMFTLLLAIGAGIVLSLGILYIFGPVIMFIIALL